MLAPSRLTGVPAIVAARPTLYRSLRITVSLPLADALAPGSRTATSSWRPRSR